MPLLTNPTDVSMTVTQNEPVSLTSRQSDDEFNFGQSPPRHRVRSSTPPPPPSAATRTPETPHPARVYSAIPETEEETDDDTPTGRLQHRLTRSEREARRGNPRRRLIASYPDGDGNWTSSVVQTPTTTLVAPAVVTIRDPQDREQQDWAAFPDAQPREEDEGFTFIPQLTWSAAREIARASLTARGFTVVPMVLSTTAASSTPGFIPETDEADTEDLF